MRFIPVFLLLSFLSAVFGDNMYLATPAPPTDLKDTLNLTTCGPYTYSQSGHHFYGTAYDGTWIDTTGCCSGQSGSCRDNPSCQCQVSVGPLPQGTYTLGNMMTFKRMPYWGMSKIKRTTFFCKKKDQSILMSILMVLVFFSFFFLFFYSFFFFSLIKLRFSRCLLNLV